MKIKQHTHFNFLSQKNHTYKKQVYNLSIRRNSRDIDISNCIFFQTSYDNLKPS